MRHMGSSGLRVPEVGQGTWQMDFDDRRRCIATLRHGFELGMRHIDTAELYGNGWVERRIVREALVGVRQQIFVVSKVRPPHTRYRSVIRACERSLRRMKTDWIDLYLLHWKGTTPLDDTLEAFERLKDHGKIRAYGLSNFALPDLKDAVRLAGPGRIACNQVAYSVINRCAERDMIPWCAKHGVSVVAYSPLGARRFPDAKSEQGRVLAQVGAIHGATPQQVALAFLLRHREVFVIPKHSSRKHAHSNAEAAGISLSAAGVKAIDAAFPLVRPARPLPAKRRFLSIGAALRTLYGAAMIRAPAARQGKKIGVVA